MPIIEWLPPIWMVWIQPNKYQDHSHCPVPTLSYKYQSLDGCLLFAWFGLKPNKYLHLKLFLTYKKLLNRNLSNRRSALKWYFPLRSKRVFSGKRVWLPNFFLKMAQLWPLFVYFCLFKQTLQFLKQINVKKCPTNIQRRNSNSQPSDYESPPLTTRPGLPPIDCLTYNYYYYYTQVCLGFD